MKEHLGRCAEHLRKAVRHLANSSDTPREKLTSMYDDAWFGSICQDDFPDGSLRNGYLTIRGSLIKASAPQVAVNIAAMSDEQARKVIAQICWFSEAVAYALGGQSISA
jgi:hypothetical protein